MARVHSSDPAHRRRVAAQRAARSRGVRAGKLRTGGYTFRKGARRGQTVHYGAPTRRDARGRPIYSANPKDITVLKRGGGRKKTTAREAIRGMREGRYVLREIRRG